MAQLWGRNWTRDELRRRSGQIGQIAGAKRYELQEGNERGVEVCEIRTGSGFRFGVCPSRGMDIVFSEHNGRSLCWHSATGWPHPAYFENDNFGWLRGFGGGLLTTCGFNSFSVPNEDGGEQFGIHDRASYLPATNVRAGETWHGDELEIWCEGAVRETRVFGANLVLQRRVSARLGEDKLTVRDVLSNDGFEPAPAVILYHCNFGFPVVSEHSQIRAPSVRCEPRDEAARAGADDWAQLEPPQAGYAERCYFHAMTPDESGFVRAEIWNPDLQFGGYVRYRAAELPHFTQWKMMGAGTYVCGLEPSNAHLTSRAELRARGELPILQPGQSWDFEVELGISDR